MSSKTFAGIAGLALALGLGLGAGPAQALEMELPGERQLAIHGFYELRVKEFGEDTPNAGMASLSQFRHVLSLETELGVFPEGIGPFDTVLSFARWTISYECIYTRTCSMFPSSDSYGEHRTPIREPDHFKHARTRPPFAGGYFPVKDFTGTNVSTRQRVTPNQRYTECLNPDGKFTNAFPLSAFCNLYTRTDLDQPIDLYLPLFTRTRGGFVHQQLSVQLLRAARPQLGEAEFQAISALPQLDRDFQPARNNSIARGFLAEIARAEAAGDTREVQRLQGKLDEFSMGITGVPYAETRNARTSEILDIRSDPDRFAPLDRANNAQIGQTLWGASQYTDTIVPWLTNMGFEVRPWGYFTSGAIDSVNPSSIGLAESFTGLDRVTGGEIIDTGVDQIPFFFGPDGVRHTPDDLPNIACPDANGNETAPGADGRCIDPDPENDPTDDASDPDLEPLYYTVPERRLPSDPNDPNSPLAPVPWTQATCDSEVPLDGINGAAGGFNSRGQCVILSIYGQVVGDSVLGKGSGTLAALDRLLDPRFRPSSAGLDPADATDLRARASGARTPARPRAPGGGLYYTTRGLDRLKKSSHNLVSNLDVGFDEDELTWEHGAGQDEHEFSEGYLEFEFLDSQVFARAGKLITVWGKTELFRNQDRINPVDIGLGTLSRLEESRLGQWAVQTIISPEMFMRVGPFEDLRLEIVGVFDQFEPTDLGECGEGQTFELVCLKTFGAIASGMAGLGIVGEDRPDENWDGLAQMDFGARIEGRWDRFTFAISDFWGWDDSFLLDVVQQYGRRVDPETGAPVNSIGPLRCDIRTDGEVAVGPDGQPNTGDEAIPSVGNCLLFDNPTSPIAVQTLRAEDAVALNHSANQTLFATICSLTFDEDSGQCAVDILNDYTLFGAVSSVLGGGDLITGLAIEGIQFARPAGEEVQPVLDENGTPVRDPAGNLTFPRCRDGSVATPAGGVGVCPFDKNHLEEIGSLARGGPSQVYDNIFAQLPDPSDAVDFENEAIFSTTTPEQRALLGCGEAFLSACDSTQLAANQGDPSFLELVGIPFERRELLRGGVDFLNADASVLTQEFTLLKVLSPGALIGTRPQYIGGPLRFEAGITGSNYITPTEAATAGVPSWIAVRNATSLDLFEVPYSQLTNRAQQMQTATDFNIEPPRWLLDNDALSRGAIVFQDPRGPNGVWDGGTGDDVFDPLGENCSGIFATQPDPGCTALEVISANIERLTIAGEIQGGDRAFDPPETFAEIMAMLDNDPRNDLDGDPIAGPDGIFWNNFDANADGRIDSTINERGDQKAAIAAPNLVVVPSFMDCLRGTRPGGPIGPSGAECYLNLDNPSTRPLPPPVVVNGVPVSASRDSSGRLIALLPIGMRLNYWNNDGTEDTRTPIGASPNLSRAAFPFQILSPFEMQQLIQSGELLFDRSRLPEEVVAELTSIIGAPLPEEFVITGDLRSGFFERSGFDKDSNSTIDFDEDYDNTLDFLDDGLAGPVSDDNILCGSGVPGDVLQTAAQHELSAEERSRLEAAGGLPPRSPIFCRGAMGLLGATAFTLPTVKAGGDGRFGRRDFLWQGGRQVVLDYQKVNVLGFSLDFAEDITKTSWGIEFSASSDKLIPNVDDFSGYSSSNDYVLSISIDRPTFFNFLNPNRSFFVNFQFFLRYLDDYNGGHGGSDNKDGNFPAAIGPISGLVTLTMFTGYFQDRLNPRFTVVFDPTTSTGGLITGLGYRFTESFSTAISVNHFFGHHVQNRASSYPIALYGNDDFTSDGFRGLAPVTNRDEIGWVVRYSF